MESTEHHYPDHKSREANLANSDSIPITPGVPNETMSKRVAIFSAGATWQPQAREFLNSVSELADSLIGHSCSGNGHEPMEASRRVQRHDFLRC